MPISPHQACYFAHELTRLGAVGELDRLSTTLFDSKVDLNPHQVDAALFALSNPLQQGVILADEVGLGKTIEAGLVLCQRWAERRRKLAIVCPAHIRKQWQAELSEKFNLPAIVIDRRAYRRLQAEDHLNPFDSGSIAILSYGFASRMKDELRATPFDLVVFDEAHKLRNAYQPSRKGGQAIRWAFERRQKLLLTATPLQNNLLELYGLGWVIGDQIFGDRNAFKARYTNAGGDLLALRERLAHFCKRTLRRDCDYINYTKRQAMTHPFEQTAEEKQLHRDVVDFMARDVSFAIPHRQRHLIEMILFKTLASSPQALAGTLGTMRRRLIALRDGLDDAPEDLWLDELALDEDMDFEELLDGLDADEPGDLTSPAVQGRLLAEELATLDGMIHRAHAIRSDSKAKALLGALDAAFQRLADVGANRKALIFTESRKTQQFLADYLCANGYAGKVIAFNGSNTHPDAKDAYERYVRKHAGSDKLTGSKPIDMRSALIEQFRDRGEILLATEAAAEGVNLQFCSLVANYDLPWNPQRVEQRIGRCHRYGQKHDVVVLNFLSRDNLADRRVHDLLDQKFKLFDGIFGVSDDVLGSIEDGVDFEKRVLDILKHCRTDTEINRAFDELQRELEDSIGQKMADAQQQLFDHFDADVHERLKLRGEHARDALDRVGERFWKLARWGLGPFARFSDADLALTLDPAPGPDIPLGRYQLISAAKAEQDQGDDAHLLRLSSPLGQWLTDHARQQDLTPATVRFDVTGHPRKVSMLDPLIGSAGWLRLDKLTLHSDATEEFLLLTAINDFGENLDPEVIERLLDVDGQAVDGHPSPMTDARAQRMADDCDQIAQATLTRALEASGGRFREFQAQINQWADDKILAAEEGLAKLKREIRVARRTAETADNTQQRADAEQEVLRLERRQRTQRRAIFDLEDQIESQRKALIDKMKKQAAPHSERETLFELRWEVV